MDRRDFIKAAGTAGLIAWAGPGWIRRALAAEPRAPMGRPLGPGETLLVSNARLVDVVSGSLFTESALLIKGGKIEKLLSGSEAGATGSDRAIDAGGRYVIPGLINAHCHMSMPGAAALSMRLLRNMGEQIDRNCVDCITHGVTTVRDQAGPQDTIIKHQELIARNELMGPRILRAIAVDVPGGYMGGGLFGAVGFGVNKATNAAEARDAVAMAVYMGADHIKMALQYTTLFQGKKPLPQMTDEMFAAAVGKAESLGVLTAVHHTSLEGFRKAMRAGVHSFEHMSSDQHLTDDDIQGFIEAGRIVVPTGSVAWALVFPKNGDENFDHPNVQRLYDDKQQNIDEIIDEYALPPIARVAKNTYEKYNRPGFFDKKHVMITPEAGLFNSAGAIGGDNMMKMYHAGCRMGCGNDGGIPLVWPGAMPQEMLLNQDAGMKPADVLRSTTLINAENIGMQDQIGTIESGKTADLVILEANPLETMENMAKVAAVLQSGRLVHSIGTIKES